MKQLLIKIGVGVVSFAFFLVLFGKLLNKGTTDMTVEMTPATFPIITFLSGDETFNPTSGYLVRQNPALCKENITPLRENRSLAFHIKTYENVVDAIYLEVRTKDGSRLIEDTQIKNYETDGDGINVYTSLKDLLKDGEEYALTIRLVIDERDVFYDTKVVPKEEVDVQTFLAFTHEFTDRTFGEKEEYSELKKYLESNSSGDNSDFGHVDIHSSLEQVAWGNLEASRETDIESRLIAAEKDSASLIQYYLVQIGSGEKAEHYRVKEYFRVSRGTDRMHLLEYERSMSRLVFEEDSIYFGDTLFLGIDDGTIQMMESPEGGKVAFVKDGVLFQADAKENRFARVYSYYDKSNYKDRPIIDLPDIRILTLDEEGTTSFAVYGYIPRGVHEGETGLLVYTFNQSKNTLEERAYIPYSGSPKMLKANIDNLIYLNAENYLFFFLDGGLYRMSLDDSEATLIAGNLSPKDFCISDDNTTAAWITEGGQTGAKVIEFENLETMRHIQIKAESGEVIKPEGFMGVDLVYGVAKSEDVSVDAFGEVVFPMHSIRIQTEEGSVLKEYSQEGIYVTDCIFEDNLITLNRVRRTEEGAFKEIDSDSIVDNTPEHAMKNKLEEIVTENYETVYQITMTGEIEEKVLQRMQPKFTLFEEEQRVEIAESSIEDLFFSYVRGEISGMWEDEADAVREAFANNGFVLNGKADLIWEKKSLTHTKNQIMAIKEATVPEDSTSLAVALETMMQFEGFSQDADPGLNSGNSPKEIMEKYMPDRIPLNLFGCPMDVVYYYLDQDIPVMVMMENGGGILLTGYNSGELVWMEPAKGTLHKVSKEESRKMFATNNNRYVTYVRCEE